MREERKVEWKDILDGVGLFVRDVDLPKHCAEKYRVGAIGSPSNRIAKRRQHHVRLCDRVGHSNV